MRELTIILDKVLDLDKWQILQDSLSIQTKLAIVTVDYKGVPVTKHSNCSAFCASVRGDATHCQLCHKCDSRGGLEAVRQNKPFIYLCHYGLVDIAIPIIINGNYVGAIMAGQVRISGNERNLERIISRHAHSLQLSNDIEELINLTPILSYSEIELAADMLNKICDYVIEEALKKNSIINFYERLYLSDKDKIGVLHSPPMDSNIANNNQIKHPILNPAIDYIDSHIADELSIAILARLCNISVGYFSRLFTSVLGCNYTDYIAKLRINIAKKMLIDNVLSINIISDKLGYTDPSYFNRTFKKHTGTTPGNYRVMNTKFS